jgi:hypothetical protein
MLFWSDTKDYISGSQVQNYLVRFENWDNVLWPHNLKPANSYVSNNCLQKIFIDFQFEEKCDMQVPQFIAPYQTAVRSTGILPQVT